MAIEKIQLIVHPLFGQISEYRTTGNVNRIAEYRGTAERKLAKNRLANFGNVVRKVAREENTILCMVPTGEYSVITRAQMDYERLEAFARKTLGGRFVVLDRNIGYREPGPEDMSMRSLERRTEERMPWEEIEGRVRIVAGGEYVEECIKNACWHLKRIFKKHGKKVSVSYMKDALRIGSDAMIRQAEEGRLTAFRKWRQKTYGKRKVRVGAMRVRRR